MIKVKEVSKNFEDFVALDNITCNISDGCIYGMVGSNGAGKSTFLRVLAGIYKPEKGEAYIDDAPIYENPKIKENVVLVADELFFLPGANMNKWQSCTHRYMKSSIGKDLISLQSFSS